jgi:hypothetical protein
LTREYYNTFKEKINTEISEKSKNVSEKDECEEYDNRRKEFLYDINTTGKYHILKEKMKKTIVRIVKEHFGKKGPLQGLKQNELDHFYSELYVFLTEQMRNVLKDMRESCINELH